MAMARIPEPELMDEPAQALAYATADFEQPHQRFIDLFRERMGEQLSGEVLDLGCGPGDVTARFARAFPACVIDAVDGAENMLQHARQRMQREGLASRVRLIQAYLPRNALAEKPYDGIISNSLLHHLANPSVLWQEIARHAKPGTKVFVMDLLRPETPERAQELVREYAASEPRILQQDFYHSLLAAYRQDEIEAQLQQHGLHTLKVEPVSDRHLVIYGVLA